MQLAMALPPESYQERAGVSDIVQEYGKRLFRFIRGRVKNDADAEDILQDVWYQLSKVSDGEPIEQISSWLYRVVRNRLTDRYRKRKADSLGDYVYNDDEGEIHFKELLMLDDNTPETELYKSVVWEAFKKALDELPAAQRDVFIWNEMEDETFQSISDRTGENIKTLISRKRYAVQHLRARLETVYHEYFN